MDAVATPVRCSAQDTPCEYRVCLTFDASLPLCTKDGPISHVCAAEDGACWELNSLETDLLGFDVFSNGGADVKVEPFSMGTEICQTGMPGEKIQFIIKDGNACEGSSALALPPVDGFTPTLQCSKNSANRMDAEHHCSGAGAIDKECVWEVFLPDSCPSSSSDPASTAPSAAPTTSVPTTTAPAPLPESFPPTDHLCAAGKLNAAGCACCDPRCKKCGGCDCASPDNGPGADYCCTRTIWDTELECVLSSDVACVMPGTLCPTTAPSGCA